MRIPRTRWAHVPPWAVAVLVALLTAIALSADGPTGWAFAGAVLAPAVAAALLGPRPAVALGVCAATASALAAAVDDAVPPWSVALAAALGVLAFLAGRRSPRPGPALAAFGVGLLPPVLVGAGAWAAGLFLLSAAVALPWLIGRSARQQADLAAAAAAHVHLRERARIAHDVHDTLGHELSLLALRAGALELAPDLAEGHRAAVADLRAAAATATERLAELVALLRAGEPPPVDPAPEDVETLVARAVAAGVPATVDWAGPRSLPHLADRTARHVVREALTNAAKHAPGSPVRVRVVNTGSATTVSVTNAVPAAARRGPGGRAGLTALRERVRLVGGTFEAGRGDGGFRVVATLPHEGGP
ncbi:sensor histidine kinase [Saccharothrix algeriensis]|uniref:histidine kinase n=1 Tax=Saccharothrix algeriensis TaxID=173560 RepID=A0ABS2S4Q5_9PSEU|nr:histidine kinase [Saccharothrix algeriensis]MBM7811216.1 signal transduction histidine kinase [Saccharothrix algeriensis]